VTICHGFARADCQVQRGLVLLAPEKVAVTTASKSLVGAGHQSLRQQTLTPFCKSGPGLCFCVLLLAFDCRSNYWRSPRTIRIQLTPVDPARLQVPTIVDRSRTTFDVDLSSDLYAHISSGQSRKVHRRSSREGQPRLG
jgi:hypothetical protein